MGAYLDRQQSCCRVSARAAAHYTGCCRRRTHRNEYDSASPPHTWQNTHSTLTTPHLRLSLGGGVEDRGRQRRRSKGPQLISMQDAAKTGRVLGDRAAMFGRPEPVLQRS